MPFRLVPTLSSAPSRFASRRSALFRDTYQRVVKLRSAPRKSLLRMSTPNRSEPVKRAFCRMELSKSTVFNELLLKLAPLRLPPRKKAKYRYAPRKSALMKLAPGAEPSCRFVFRRLALSNMAATRFEVNRLASSRLAPLRSALLKSTPSIFLPLRSQLRRSAKGTRFGGSVQSAPTGPSADAYPVDVKSMITTSTAV